MIRCMEYCLGTVDKGLELRPHVKWNGEKGQEFVIHGFWTQTMQYVLTQGKV